MRVFDDVCLAGASCHMTSRRGVMGVNALALKSLMDPIQAVTCIAASTIDSVSLTPMGICFAAHALQMEVSRKSSNARTMSNTN